MDWRTEPLSREQILLQVALMAGLVLGLAIIVYLLTRASTRTRIRGSEAGQVLRWWLLPAALWAAFLIAGNLLVAPLERLDYLLATIMFGVLVLTLVLAPCACLLATVLWAWPRLRSKR